jgi:hypothetical protein
VTDRHCLRSCSPSFRPLPLPPPVPPRCTCSRSNLYRLSSSYTIQPRLARTGDPGA